MTLVFLFFQFLKFGALAFGGGVTILPLLFDTFVYQEKLFSADAFGNLISIGEITPGPVTINLATFIGFSTNGFWGSIVCTLGLICPSLIVTGSALFFMKKYQESWIVEGFLKGARLLAFVMVSYAAVLFLNMSVLSDTWTVEDIWQSLIERRFIGPENYHVNFLELGVAVISFILIHRQIYMIKVLIGAAVVGYAVSFL